MAQGMKTKQTSVRSIMRTKAFVAGFEDKQFGLPFAAAYESWTAVAQQDYERGRMLAARCPGLRNIKDGRKLRSDAVRAAQQMTNRGELI